MIEKALLEPRISGARGRPWPNRWWQIPYFPNMVTQMISIGEQTVTSTPCCRRWPILYEDEVNNATDAMTSLLEPIQMVVLGGIVAVIVVAMYLPIFNMAGAVQG